MVYPYGQWQYHEQYIHVENYREEIPEEIKNFSKEVPAIEKIKVKDHYMYIEIQQSRSSYSNNLCSP